MASIKISSNVDEPTWNELSELAKEFKCSVPDLIAEAVQEYLDRRRRQRRALDHLEDSIRENESLGELLE